VAVKRRGIYDGTIDELRFPATGDYPYPALLLPGYVPGAGWHLAPDSPGAAWQTMGQLQLGPRRITINTQPISIETTSTYQSWPARRKMAAQCAAIAAGSLRDRNTLTSRRRARQQPPAELTHRGAAGIGSGAGLPRTGNRPGGGGAGNRGAVRAI